MKFSQVALSGGRTDTTPVSFMDWSVSMVMIRVLIAEDEIWIRRGIIKYINWETLGMELIAEAGDGLKAVELINFYKPDMVLVDVRMPGCDGLQLIQEVSRNGYNPKFIIVSGYDNFEYARRAISLGAFAYLLKPVKKDELNKTLQEAHQAIIKEREFRQSLNNVIKRLNEAVPIVKESIMGDILSGRAKKDINQDLITFSPFYAVLITGICGYINICRNKEQANRIRKEVISHINIILKDYGESIVFEKEENCIVVVLGLPSDSSFRHMVVARQILDGLGSKGYSVTIGTGLIYPDVSNIKKSYDEAIKSYREKVIVGGNRIITPSQRFPDAPVPSDKQIKSLCLALELYDIRGVRLTIQDLLNTLVSEGCLCYEAVYKLVSCISSAVWSVMSRYGIDNEYIRPADVDFIEGFDNLKEHLENSLVNLAERIEASKSRNSLKAVDAAVDFINSHYSEDISLDRVALHVNLNPNYLSEVFKRKTGVNFTEYLLTLRMDKAKDLITKNPGISVSKVAEMIGYSNTRYFSSLFSKYVGIRPSEYKELMVHRHKVVLEDEDIKNEGSEI